MDDLVMTFGNFVNGFIMLICSEKYHVSGATYGYTKHVVIDRCPTL